MFNFLTRDSQLSNHPAISEILNGDDEQALQYMDGLSVDEFEDVKSGFKINLVCNQNTVVYVYK